MRSTSDTTTNTPEIEIVSNVPRRRRWTLDEKVRTVEEATAPGITVSSVARKYGIAPSLLFRWRRLVANGGRNTGRDHQHITMAAQVQELTQRIRELERLLGKKTLENEILKEALDTAKLKRLLARGALGENEDAR